MSIEEDGGLEVIKSNNSPERGDEKKGINNEKMTEQFLSKNPNPILRVETEGTIIYANKAANLLLEYWSVKEGEKVPQSLRHSIKRVLSQKNPENLEIQTGKATYSVLLYPFPEEDYVNIQGFDISSRILAEEKLRKREKQYLSLSKLGRISISCKDFQAILEESARLISQGLGAEFSMIVELMPDGNFIMRAGYGWEEGLAGNVIIREEKSHSGYTLLARKPVVLEDIETETRFKCSEFLSGHGVTSGVTVLIGDINKPFGVLGVYSTVKRDFTAGDIYFLDSAAFLLSEIIERFNAEEKLRVHHQELERLVEKRTLEYAEANEKLAQEVTDRRKIEKTLMNTVSFLETLLDSVPSPVFQRDLNATYVNCNESFASQIMGLPKDTVIGGSFQEFQKRIPKELAEIYLKHDMELTEKKGSQYYETKVVCADGVQRDFLFHKATYEDGSGEVAGVVGVMLDITQRKAAEKTFRKSEERYRIAVEQTGQLVYDYDVESGKIDWAGAISQITGYSPEKFKQVNLEGWIANIHPEDRKKAWEAHEICMKNGGRYLEEYRFGKKDGSYFHAEDSSIYLLDEEGRINRIVGVIKDITDRKFASGILERSEERYRAVAVQTGQLIYDYDVENHHSSWAGAIEELTGYSFEEFQSFTPEVWAEHIHPEDREKAVRAHESCMKNGEKYIEEYRLKGKGGRYFYVEDSGVYLKDENRGIYRVLGVMKDITERKLASEKLKESEERYKSFMKNFRGIAFQVELDLTPILVDGSVEEIVGYKGDDFISGKVDWYQIVLPEDRKRLFEKRGELIKDPLLLIEHEYRIKHRNGKISWVREIIQNVLDAAGKKRILQGSIYDITKQKEAEDSLTKIEEIRKKEIHHRIKNNLQVISSLLGLQAERFNEKEVLEAFQESQNRVVSMAIIHEELYQSRNNETLDFSAYLQKLTSLLRSYTVRKDDVKIQLDLEETFLGMDTAVPLGMIINELVTNSLKHAFPPGTGGEIRINLCKTEESRDNININNSTNNIVSKSSVDNSNKYELIVSDNGLGFPENVDFRNTGSLGLQLVNILVEQLEGTIELKKGEGTVFKMFFKEND